MKLLENKRYTIELGGTEGVPRFIKEITAIFAIPNFILLIIVI